MNKIRILFTIPNFDTAGSGFVVFNLARNLNKNIFDVHICSATNKGDFFKTVEASGIPLHVFPYIAERKHNFSFLVSVFKTASFFRKIKPDIIHSYNYTSEYSEALAARFAGSKWVFTKKSMEWGRRSWHIRSALANKIIATNSSIHEQFYNGSSKVQVIYSGVDINFFKPLPFSNAERNFCVVGNIGHLKGSDYIADAFIEIAKKNNECKLFFIGDGDTEFLEKLKAKLQSLINSGRVIFTGRVNNVSAYLEKSFCLIMAADKRGEGGPLAVLEAMASGRVVIGSRVPGIMQQLEAFPDFMFEANNASAIAQKMEEVYNTPFEAIEQTALQMRAAVEKRFSLQRETKEHETFYLELLKHKKPLA